MRKPFTKVSPINKEQHISIQEKDEILTYVNNFIFGAVVEDSEKSFIMSIIQIDDNVYEVRRCFWQLTVLGKTLSSPYTALIRLK